MQVIQNIMKKVSTLLSTSMFAHSLPGQGIFNNEKTEDADFTVSLHQSEVPTNPTPAEVSKLVNYVVNMYEDSVHIQYAMVLERAKLAGKYRKTDVNVLCKDLKNRKFVITNNYVGSMLRDNKSFKPARSYANDKMTHIGDLGKAKVYVSPYIYKEDVYVVDQSIIDVRYNVEIGERGRSVARIRIRTKSNPDNVTKYVLNN